MPFDLYRLARPLIYQLSPETAHNSAMRAGRIAQAIPGLMPLAGACIRSGTGGHGLEALGLKLPSPIGLAAGLDKGAEVLPMWKALGFGSVEIGTVTPRPQPGNPQPRCFRLVDESLLLNRMGFNSEGAEVVAARLKRRPSGLIVGGNIGKNKVTPEEQALDDYRTAYRLIAPLVDYTALNISSPNTPGLRRLQAPEALAPLLEGMMQIRKEMGLERQPLLVKLAPDLSPEELDGIVDVIAASGVSGIIATNTTLDRGIVSDLNRDKVLSWGDGGLSGKGLKIKAREIQRRILQRIPPHLKLVACGGLGSAEDVRTAMEDGAAWVQIYSSLIFEGPFIVRRILKGL
nr:quinone-dependent dihydroorotate dehydrogenase [uncultured Holophaga sp.]